LPDFSRRNLPKLGKIYPIATKLPNGRMYYNQNVQRKPIPIFSITRPSNIYPKLDFWFEKETIWQPCRTVRHKKSMFRVNRPLPAGLGLADAAALYRSEDLWFVKGKHFPVFFFSSGKSFFPDSNLQVQI
jgi:hypothetical protein